MKYLNGSAIEFIWKSVTFAVIETTNKKDTTVATAVRTQTTTSIKRKQEACPENLSKAGKY